MLKLYALARPNDTVGEEKIEELASLGCSVEEIAPMLTPPGSKRAVDHRTIERRFTPALKKGRHNLARTLRSALVRRAMGRGTPALFSCCKAILKTQEPIREQISLNGAAAASAEARTPFVMNDTAKKKLADAMIMIRREALRGQDDQDRLNIGERQGGQTPPSTLNG